VNSTATSALCMRRAKRLAARTGSLMARLASLLMITPILVVGAAVAQSPACTCAGKLLHSEQGGQGDPLAWAFTATEKQPATSSQAPTICYVKSVVNHSPDDVRDIAWKVADYKRMIIPKNTPQPSCMDIVDHIKLVSDRGPLNFGTSSQPYDTVVWPPASGWKTKTAANETTSFEPLKSEFSFAYKAKNGETEVSHVIIHSSATYNSEKKNGMLKFDINNDGKSDVFMFLNFPDAVRYFFPDRPFPAGKEARFEIPVSERPEPKPTTVIFFNGDGGIAALDTAGLYVPEKGIVKFSHEELWSEH
jgi:hypothetical protein